MTLILASRSPRRAELLTAAGIAFEVLAADVDETPHPGETPEAYVERLAIEKARAVLALLNDKPKGLSPRFEGGQPKGLSPRLEGGQPKGLSPRFEGDKPKGLSPRFEGLSPRLEGVSPRDVVVLGADTTVTIDGLILGKPADAAEATGMLRRLRGRVHDVFTGVALVRAAGVDSAVERTRVWFGPMTDEDISWYVASGEPVDRAGAYAIQGLASRFIPRIEGSYTNVVGLPVAVVSSILRAEKP